MSKPDRTFEVSLDKMRHKTTGEVGYSVSVRFDVMKTQAEAEEIAHEVADRLNRDGWYCERIH